MDEAKLLFEMTAKIMEADSFLFLLLPDIYREVSQVLELHDEIVPNGFAKVVFAGGGFCVVDVGWLLG